MMSTTYVFLFVFLFFILSSSHIFSICLPLHSSQCAPLSFLSFPLCLIALHLLIRPYRSRSADSGSMYMMNWAGTPAAQVPPRVHGDTTRGELLCSAVTYDTLLLCMHTWNSLHRPCEWVNSPTAASNMISQCFIHNTKTLQCKYWSYSGEVSALTHTWRIVLAAEG